MRKKLSQLQLKQATWKFEMAGELLWREKTSHGFGGMEDTGRKHVEIKAAQGLPRS